MIYRQQIEDNASSIDLQNSDLLSAYDEEFGLGRLSEDDPVNRIADIPTSQHLEVPIPEHPERSVVVEEGTSSEEPEVFHIVYLIVLKHN
jgi:hypothetical protein